MSKRIEQDDETIKDGESVTVKMTMMDAVQRSVAGHRPGFAVADTDNATIRRARVREMARDFRKAELSAQWKGGLQDGDTIMLGGRRVEVLGHNPKTGKVVLADATPTPQTRQKMYDQYDAELSGLWQQGFPHGAEPGDGCIINGAAGHLVRGSDGRLFCRPDVRQATETSSRSPTPQRAQREPSDKEWAMAEPLSDSRQVKDEAYAEYQSELENAWRR